MDAVTDQISVTIEYEDGEDGWIIASVPAVPGTFSQGRTREEARRNVLDALAVMLAPEEELSRPGVERESVSLTPSI